MKIAVIAPTSIPARRANTIQVMKMTQALVEQGHDVRLAVPATSASISVSWEQLSHHYGLKIRIPISWLPARPALRGYGYGWRGFRWAKRWKADLVYTRLPQAAAFSSMSGTVTVLEVHDLPQGILGPVFFRRFLNGRGARRLVVISQALLLDLIKRFATPASPFTQVAPDGVDLERYVGLPEPDEARLELWRAGKFPLDPRRFTAGYTGHLYAGRGSQLLLDLASDLPEINFLIVGGDPSDVHRLRTAAESRHLGNLILTGFVPNAELPYFQAACELLLMPYQRKVAGSSGGDISRYLSPMKLFEYLACGRVILSSDLPVLREVLNSENALLLPVEDVKAWATSIQKVRDDAGYGHRLAERARCDALRYTWEGRAARILEGIEQSRAK
ncbi:MAG TPA: glycosyltransferase [Anaerolineales bacterium]|nr:glycosyltransferase [Anaerolineales bacterium]